MMAIGFFGVVGYIHFDDKTQGHETINATRQAYLL